MQIQASCVKLAVVQLSKPGKIDIVHILGEILH